MSNVIKKIKIKQQDGTFTDYIPIGAEAKNINVDGESVETKLDKKPYYYDSVANMQVDDNLKVGDMVITLGYYEANDGGGARYRIVDGNYTDDGGEYHELDNGFFAELIVNGDVYPEYFGAKGDNSTDDQLSIQNCIDYANKYHLSIAFMQKQYKINSSIILRNNNPNINGNECWIRGAFDGPIIGMESGTRLEDCVIENIRISGANEESYTNNYGLYVRGIYCLFKNIRIGHCYIGFYMDHQGISGNLVGNHYTEIGIRYCFAYSMWLGATNNNSITDGWIESCTFGGTASEGHLRIGSGAGYKIENIHTWGGGGTPIMISNCARTNINNIYIESFRTYGIACHIARDVNISNVTMKWLYDDTFAFWFSQSTNIRSRCINISNVWLDTNDETEPTNATLFGGDYQRTEDIYYINLNVALTNYKLKPDNHPNIRLHNMGDWPNQIIQQIALNTLLPEGETSITLTTYIQSLNQGTYYISGASSFLSTITDLPTNITTSGNTSLIIYKGNSMTTSNIELWNYDTNNQYLYKGFYTTNTNPTIIWKTITLS